MRRRLSRRASRRLFKKYASLTRSANIPKHLPRGGFRL